MSDEEKIILSRSRSGSWIGRYEQRHSFVTGTAISALNTAAFKIDTFAKAVDYIKERSPRYASAEFFEE